MKTPAILIGLLTLTVAQAVGAQAVPPQQTKASKILQQLAVENATNVGRILPTGIQVLLDNGATVDLRSELRGRTILIEVKPGRCPACQQIFSFLQANAASFSKAQHARIVVLVTESATPPNLSMPAKVTVLHTASAMTRKGFLAGKWTPATFFFDTDHKLIKRQTGLVGEPESTLRFPSTPNPK